MPSPPVVAIFNSSQDTVGMLRWVLEQAGYVAVAAFTYDLRDGKVDLESFVRQHQPAVVVYDIAPPYDQNWRLFLHIRDAPACRGTDFILTSTNVGLLQKVVGPVDQVVHEIIGKPYDLREIVRAVEEVLKPPSIEV